MDDIKILDQGIIYRNPKPYLRSVQAYFPSVAYLGNSELLATMIIGEAFEAVNCRIHLSRSLDSGKTWKKEGVLTGLPMSAKKSEGCRITAISHDELVAWVFTHAREDTEVGLVNPENMGFVPTKMSLYRSKDKGYTWSGPEKMVPPLIGPAFECCCPITTLSDGRWLAPTSTWRGFTGSCSNGMKAVNFISYDKGKTWPEYMDVMDNSDQSIIYWEQKTIEIESNKLLAVAWTYDENKKVDIENSYAISCNGKTFTQPKTTGLKGQTAAILHLGKDVILSVYRRMDEPGLWANISSIKTGYWVNINQVKLWGGFKHETRQNVGNNIDMVEEFQQLKFGAPCMLMMEDGIIFVSFWCVENCVSSIKWFKLQTV